MSQRSDKRADEDQGQEEIGAGIKKRQYMKYEPRTACEILLARPDHLAPTTMAPMRDYGV